jgi:hypothetical protein
MSDAVTIPTWVGILVAIGTPLTTFAGVLLANFLSRKGAVELEARSRREETMRNLRWAAELAVSDDQGKANLGLAELNALGQSALSDQEQQVFIDAALEAVLLEPEEAIEVAERQGVDVVVEVGSTPSGHDLGGQTGVRSKPDESEDDRG